MTDSKSWLWRKKSSEKTVVAAEKVELSSRVNEEEFHVLLAEKAQLEKDVRDLDDRLSSALTECDAKDDTAKKHAKTAKEALAGWEKSEAKSVSLKQELDEALNQRDISEERARHLDAALKECMQQLHFVREEQERRIHSVMLKASEELEETKMILEEKLEESDQYIAKMEAENTQLGKVLFQKDQLIGDLNQQIEKTEADVNALLKRLEHMEKDNASLIYEVRILEKEVDIRNEEREFNRRTAEATHKQHLENVKKIAKLESECQRLRVLVRKRLPGPAALAKMKTEVGMLQRESADNRRRKSYSNVSNLKDDYSGENHLGSPMNKNLSTERICALEDENHFLREALQKHLNELQISGNKNEQTARKVSQVEEQVLPRDHVNRNTRTSRIAYDQSLASMSDVGSDDKVSCASSWASALVSEQEVYKGGKDKVGSPSKSVAVSDINHFMDDFAEMEKLALVCLDKPIEDSSLSKNQSGVNSLLESTGKELVLVTSFAENISGPENNRTLPSRLSNSISKLIEIVEGIKLPCEDIDSSQTPGGTNGICTSPRKSSTSTSYFTRVFQWEVFEFASILQNVLRSCNDLMNEKTDFATFTEELTSTLEWIITHCFSQDVCSRKDELQKQLGWKENRSESETDASVDGQISEVSKLSLLKEKMLLYNMGSADSNRSEVREPSKELKIGTQGEKSVKEEALVQSGAKGNQVENSASIGAGADLLGVSEALEHSKATMEDQFESYVMTIEDLNVQLLVVKTEMSEAHQKFSALEGELKNKVKHCEELEVKCLHLQSQIERAQKTNTNQSVGQHKRQLQTDWEISAASEKLAECQETIFHLGEQLKTLASSRDVVSDKFISTPTHDTNTAALESTTPPSIVKELTSQRSSLLDRMQAEDDFETDHLESPETKEIISGKNFGSEQSKEYIRGNSVRRNLNETAFGSLAIVPSKKQQPASSGLFKKLLWRKKKSKKLQLSFAT